MVQRCLLTLLLSLFCIACSESVPQLPPLEANATILAIGDSLTYGTGTKRANSYPSVLAKITHHKVINAGVSGDTTAQALKRLPELLEKHYPSLVILSLGGNDLIRRVPEKTIQTNLEKMITLIQNTGASVILIAAPKPSLTLSVPDFYEEIAKKYNIPVALDLIRDLLKQRKYKSDTIHLNARGYAKLAEGIAKLLEKSGALAKN